jgi:hypothetical protein
VRALYSLSPAARRLVAVEFLDARVRVRVNPMRTKDAGATLRRELVGELVSVATLLGGSYSDVAVLKLDNGADVAVSLATVESIERWTR